MKKIQLHNQILIGMFIGVLSGILVRSAGLEKFQIDTIIQWVKPIGDIFLRLIFMMIIPLILTALTLGVSGLGNVSKLGKIGLKMFKFTIIATSLSVFLGCGLVAILQPGKGITNEERQELLAKFKDDSKGVLQNVEQAKSRNIGDIITNIVPKNPFEDISRAFDPTYKGGGLLAVMLFALIIGAAMTKIEPAKIAPFKAFLESLYEIVMKVIHVAMKLAPIGVASLLFVVTVSMGVSILGIILKYVGIVFFALLIHQFVTYSLILRLFTKIKPIWFFKNIQEVMITAFSTSSSNASLPIAIETATEKLKLPKEISNFILTIGSTSNQNGTALFQGVTIFFLAQCFGIELNIFQIALVLATSILAGIGTIGVPGGSLPVIMLILITIGVPPESIVLIYGVDRVLDMCRTVINVSGDLVATEYIVQSEKV